MHTIMNYPFDIEEIKAAAASATGRSHRRRGTICEDAYAIDSLRNWKGKAAGSEAWAPESRRESPPAGFWRITIGSSTPAFPERKLPKVSPRSFNAASVNLQA